MKKISIGIDFSKKTFDATIVRRIDDQFTEVAYSSFENDQKGFKTFVSWVRKSLRAFPEGKGRGTWIFCGENTGVCSAALSDFLACRGYDMWLENALVIHRKSGIVRVKNDKVDSRRIALYALRHYEEGLRLHQPDTAEYKRLSSLYTAHKILVNDKVSKINQIKSGVLDSCPDLLKMARRQLELIEEQLKCIDAQIKDVLKTTEEFKRHYEVMDSCKGIGFLTIAYIIVRTHNFKYMNDSRKFGNYIGVVPSHKEQSGTSVDKPARVSRYRDRNGNAVLTQAANSAIRHNPVIKAYYNRLMARGVHPNKAKNNCKFKLINIIMAMVDNDTLFDIEKYGKSKALWGKVG